MFLVFVVFTIFTNLRLLFQSKYIIFSSPWRFWGIGSSNGPRLGVYFPGLRDGVQPRPGQFVSDQYLIYYRIDTRWVFFSNKERFLLTFITFTLITGTREAKKKMRAGSPFPFFLCTPVSKI